MDYASLWRRIAVPAIARMAPTFSRTEVLDCTLRLLDRYRKPIPQSDFVFAAAHSNAPTVDQALLIPTSLVPSLPLSVSIAPLDPLCKTLRSGDDLCPEDLWNAMRDEVKSDTVDGAIAKTHISLLLSRPYTDCISCRELPKKEDTAIYRHKTWEDAAKELAKQGPWASIVDAIVGWFDQYERWHRSMEPAPIVPLRVVRMMQKLCEKVRDHAMTMFELGELEHCSVPLFFANVRASSQ